MINTLPEFESRQVLTSDELNWLTCYLDSQNRQTRRFMIGCGLIGGLQVKLVNNTVQVSSGSGLTSAGHIVSLMQSAADFTTYTKIKKYELKNKEKLAFHYLVDMDPVEEDYSKSTEIQSIYFQGFQNDVMELFEETANEAVPLVANEVQDKVVMLFAEIIQKELKDCADDNCQERGKKYLYSTRTLLISKEDAIKLLNSEYGVQSNDENVLGKLAFPWLHLPTINILKPVFSSVSVNDTFDENTIIKEYTRCIKDFTDHLVQIKVQLDESLTNLKNYCTSAKTGYAIADKIITLINQTQVLTAINKPPALYQIVYDYLWSVVKAYQEIQHQAQTLKAKCLTREEAFPNHVFLGLVSGQNDEFDSSIPSRYSIYRHTFQSRFTQSEQSRICNTISLLLQRFQKMMIHFDKQVATSLRPIKVTPGGNITGPLSYQAIPYYIEPAIQPTWNQWGNHSQLSTLVTNYSSVNESQVAGIQLPYNTLPSAFQGDHSFFRIEGSHGQPALSAINTVFQLRKKHGLAFEVLMLRLNEKSPFSHSFNFTINEDVESMYQVVRAEVMKQIQLNTSYLWSLQLKSGTFEPTQTALSKALEQSYLLFLGNLNATILANPIALVLQDAVTASNISMGDTMKAELLEPKFMELQSTVAKEKQPSATFMKKNTVGVAGLDIEAMKAKNFRPDIFEFEIGILFFNNLGNLVNGIKTSDKFKKTSDISFYSHLLTVAKSMRKSDKLDALFLMSLQLYCSLKLQEAYLPENFLETNILNYKENLENSLLPACTAITGHLKKIDAAIILSDDILDEVEKEEMRGHVARIRFEDDWIKIIQIDAENKKRNGGLGVENLLGRFVKLHPGLAHGCGVSNGGTYVMVYDQSNTITADFYLPYIISSHLRPIQYTLLENKTLTLTGKVKDESGNVVPASLLIGTATILTDNQGFYNALVNENTTVKVICKVQGFVTFEKDMAIKDKSITLDITLKKSDDKKTMIVRFINQLDKPVKTDIQLINKKNDKPETAVGGVLSITDVPQSSHKYEVKDDHFDSKDFEITISNTDKEAEIKLVEVDFIRIRVRDLIGGDFKPALLENIRVIRPDMELDTSDILKGKFVTKLPLDISRTPTVEVVYNRKTTTAGVNPGEKINEVGIDDTPSDTTKKLNVIVAMFYPLTDTGLPMKKLPTVTINETGIKLDEQTDLGNDQIKSDGTLTLDKRLVNAPVVTIENVNKISSTIFIMDARLIVEKADIIDRKSFFTFSTALSPVQIKELIATRSEFKQLSAHVDLNLLHFYCLVLGPADIKQIKAIAKV